MVTVWMSLSWLYIPGNLFSTLKYILANSLSLRQNIMYADILRSLEVWEIRFKKVKTNHL